MKIKALRDYRDRELDKQIKANDIYEVSDERGNYIVKQGYAVIVEEPKEIKVEAAVIKELEEEKAIVKKSLTTRKRLSAKK